MTVTITIPSSALVVVLSERRDAARHFISQQLPHLAQQSWNIDDAVTSGALLKDRLKRDQAVALDMYRSHPKARSEAARIARRQGAFALVICIGKLNNLGDDEPIGPIYRIDADEQVDIIRTPMPSDLSHLHGPFDIIGDIHGCARELKDLLVKLGHARCEKDAFELCRHIDDRRVVLLGDLVDRGPANLETLEIARRLQSEFGALVITGNHDDKFERYLRGNKITISPAMAPTVREFEKLQQSDKDAYASWLRSLEAHYVLDGGNLIVAHAGLTQQHHGRHTKGARAFALYGATTGELDAEGYPEALDWAQDYKGASWVVHGHTVVPAPRILNRVVAVDTGCVFGGSLTAFRWPEKTFVTVQAHAAYQQSRTNPKTT